MIINRYITREVMYVMLAVLGVLVVIFLSTETARYLEQAAQGNVSLNSLSRLILIAIPALTSLLLPLAYFFALLLGYGRLYVDNEMVVMNACGLSRRQLVKITLKQAVILAVIVAVLDFWLVPSLARYKTQLLSSGSGGNILEMIIPGQFQYSPDGTQFFYVQSVSHDRQQLNDVFIAQMSTMNQSEHASGNNRSWDVTYARKIYQTHDNATGDNFFTTNNGDRYIGTPGEPNYMLMKYGSYSIRMPGTPQLSEGLDIAGTPTAQLIAHYHNPVLAGEFQWRAALPISVVLMALLAVPLSQVKPRQSRFNKLLPAILIYLVYANTLYVARSWVAQGTVSVDIGMWWIHIVMLIIIGFFYIDYKKLFKRLR